MSETSGPWHCSDFHMVTSPGAEHGAACPDPRAVAVQHQSGQEIGPLRFRAYVNMLPGNE